MPPTPPSFGALGVVPELVTALEAGGIQAPFPIQAATIADGLAGRDVCGKAKTGSGKTLAFGVPLLQRLAAAGPEASTGRRRPRGLVLVPTRELAGQVAGVLDPLSGAVGLTLTACYGGTGMDAQIKALRAGTDVVVATPGRLIDLIQRGDVSLEVVEAVVIDEADRMADMGFLPQVEWLLRHLGAPHQTMLFSATLDGDVDRLVRHELADPVRHEVGSEQPTVTAMEHRFLLVHQMDKVRVLAAICRSNERVIVFSRTKRGADRVTESLRKEGVDARAIHGDLRQPVRERALQQFASGRLPVLVATDVAARGIDVDGIDVVVHFDPPEDHKAYLHRSGRTARAGREGLVVTLVLWNEQLEVERVQRRLGLRLPVTEVFSNDPRLADLRSWDPAPASVA
ncbi:DEAD/DEAH box helicase [Acidimicrobiaceae bacterium USS-CC1]|uniref:DEAD/DEAH box helicase n=1 Tax=Acidiferrimicrobium australe TaxID=2664430 RepID=A0ABW9QPP0_9ACTN|nr:DEAD/DEAH box helicase [Acidiferrimicrobium australe]